MKNQFAIGLAAGQLAALLAALPVTVIGGAETHVVSGSIWKYFDTGAAPSPGWSAPAFNDSTWASGPSQLGFGDGDEATLLSPGIITAYFRTKFNVIGANTFTGLTLRVLRDDGAAVYLNGVEVFRNNLPPGPLSYSTLATSTVGGPEETTVFLSATLDPSLLLEGENVLAAEVHQVNVTSSDLSFDLELFSVGHTPGHTNPPVPPVIVGQPQSQTVPAGATATFTVSATGTPPLSYHWRRDGATLVVTTQPSFTLSDVQPGQAGNYSVVVTNVAGTATSANAVLTVVSVTNPPPGSVTLIASNSVWKYLDNGSDHGTAWRAPGFDDSSWASGPGQLGYGDGDEATVVSFGPDAANKYITTYFRHAFEVANPSAFGNLVLRVLRDDGVAVYLNGIEVFRNNLPAGPLSFATLATGAIPDENTYLEVLLPNVSLASGRNVVAAEVHQVNPASSDVGFDVELTARTVPPLTPPGAPSDQLNPAVASDGTNFLVVWMDQRHSPGEHDIYGARVSASGEVLDPGGIPICTAATSQYYPAVAFDGTSYLVVWSDGRDSTTEHPSLDLYGARVSPAGVVLDPNAFQITHGEVAFQPSVAFNGTDYLVAGYAWEHNGHRRSTLLGVRVTSAGVVRDLEELILHQSNGAEYPAIVASLGDDWLVVWNGAGIEGARVSRDGNVSSPQRLVDDGETWIHGLAAAGGHYFLTSVANRQLAPDTYVMDVFGTWITPDGQPQSTVLIAANTNQTVGSFLQPTTYVQTRATPAANGSEVVVVWEAGAQYTNGGLHMFRSDIRSARVGADGSVSPIMSLCAAPQDQSYAGIAFNGQHFLAVWQDARTAPPDEYSPLDQFDIYGARLTAAGAAIEANGFLISTVQGEPNGERELHLVGTYSGAAAAGGPVHNNEFGDAAVLVNRPGKRISLFLASYEPSHWHITLSAGTSLERVFVSSYYTSTVDGIPANVPVTTVRVGYAYSLDSSQYLQMLPRICALTGQDISSFHGSYAAPLSTPFVVDSVQTDPRLHCGYPQPEPVDHLPSLSFQLAFFGSGRGVYFQNYSLAGPAGGGSLLPDMYVIPDLGGRYYYTADPHYVLKVDSQTGSVQDMALPSSVPELSWPMGTAYDSRRNRVLLVSLGGEGFLYAYSPPQDAWSLVTSMNNLDVDAIAYHAASDSLFGIGVTFGEGGPKLHELSPDGAPRRFIQLPVLPFSIGPGSYRSELVSVGEYLVWLIAGRYSWQTEQESRIYLIEPRTGQVWLTYRQTGPSPNDQDGDGVPDSRDQCPQTPAGAVVNEHGCSIPQLVPCAGPWTNHAEYVRAIIREAWRFFRAELINEDQRRAIIRLAVRSNCGRQATPEPMQLHLLPLTPAECQRDGMRWIVSGEQAVGECVLETSTDLLHWTALQTLDPAAMGDEIACPHSEDESSRFFRVRTGSPQDPANKGN